MQKLPTDLWPRLRPYFGDDRAGNLLGPHTLGTGHGEWWVDSWPQPAVLLVFVGGNMALLGDPGAASRGFLAEFVRERLQSWERIFVDAPGPWEPLVVDTLAPLQRWPRVSLRLVERSPHEPALHACEVRLLNSEDVPALSALSEELHWIGDAWGGLAGLASSERAWGAWPEGRLASVAAPGLVGHEIEDLFVVTESRARRRGHSTACAARVIRDVTESGKTATWTTWPSNRASLRVAQKLGFERVGEDHAWIAGEPLDE
jgi:RimJ/RimL family protein N-acetyltransferase